MSTLQEGYILNSLKPISLEGINIIYNQMKYSVFRILRLGHMEQDFFANYLISQNYYLF